MVIGNLLTYACAGELPTLAHDIERGATWHGLYVYASVKLESDLKEMG
jgi:hypothetical protein